MDANCFCSCLKSLLDVQFCANIWSWQNKIYVILCKWQKISYLVLYTQCNMDKHCCCQGLACVHCIFMVWYMYPHFHLKLKYIAIFTPLSMWIWGHCGGDRMLVGFTTTSAISAYHHWCCEFKSRSECTTLYDKVGQWLATGRWFSQGPPVSSTN